ncbi:MAG: o-succinylbenzoate synthase [Cyanobacteriota bacterium]|nr:o-succinylbenzoate synthase [Cyanobacteriota bacterium]
MDEPFQFAYCYYERPFRQPLATHHGDWSLRQSLLIRLQDQQGRVGYGEIAPVAWFGSETLDQALAFCRQLPSSLTQSIIQGIPNHLPACQFGLESAWVGLRDASVHASIGSALSPQAAPPIRVSGLLPAGEAALTAWQPLWQRGYRTFKWKIAVEALEKEQHLCQELSQQLPRSAHLRLDANGGLTLAQAKQWLVLADRLAIEFLEQPLPGHEFSSLQQLSQQFITPIALDESVANLRQLQDCYQAGWSGIFVIKPSIIGSLLSLQLFLRQHQLDIVISSVFESPIGLFHCLQLTKAFAPTRACGLGIEDFLDRDPDCPNLWRADWREMQPYFDRLWNQWSTQFPL